LIKIGVVGIGHMGKTHLFNLMKNKNVKLLGVADQSSRARAFAKKMGVKSIYSNYSELFDEPELQAVVISLPNFLKRESLEAASEKGLAVLIDKPLARNYSEAVEMEKIVQKNHSRLMVASNFRYHPHVKKMKQIIDDGNIGQCKLVSLDYINHGPFSHPLNPKPVPDWWFEKEKVGGGALIDNGWHMIDLFTWLFGEANVENAIFDHHFNLELEDFANLTIKSKNGVLGVLNVGWFSHVLFPKLDFRIICHGTIGYCNTDELKPNLYLNAAKEALINFKRKIFFQPINILTYSYYFSSYNEVLRDFVLCLEKDEEFPISLAQQLMVQEIIDKTYKLSPINTEVEG